MIILASQSPRRQELMKLTGLPFTVRGADEEIAPRGAGPAKTVEALSRAKAEEVAKGFANALIIAADTIVVIDGRELGKPHTQQDAFDMLSLLSGRTHEVVTVLSVCRGERTESEAVVTRVTFRALTDEEIRAYIATGEPMDKAGSYGIQGYGAMFVSHLEGDYFSVMGLPLCPLCRMLRAFGVSILTEKEAQEA